jgi:hypothetical protein
MTGTEEALPLLCELLDNLLDEIERAGDRPSYFSYSAPDTFDGGPRLSRILAGVFGEQ